MSGKYSLKLNFLTIMFHFNLSCSAQNIIELQNKFVSTSIVSTFNNFPRCVVHVINFQARDINRSSNSNPIVLHQYFSIAYKLAIYPIEQHGYNQSFLNDQLSFKYVSSILKNNFKFANKQLNCEATIYLDIPSLQNNRPLYESTPQYHLVVKDPFWIGLEQTFSVNSWKRYILVTTSKYSLLVCENETNSKCHENMHTAWLISVLHNPSIIRTNELILIINLLDSNNALLVHCSYCNACIPNSNASFANSKHYSISKYN